MRPQRSNFWRLALASMALGMVHCGKKAGKSQDVAITLTPAAPIVITSDLNVSFGGNSSKVKGPWFKFMVNLQNTNADPVTIVALHVEVSGVDESGQYVTVKKDFDPGMLNYSTLATVCSYSDFGQFDKGGSKEGTGTPKLYNNLPLYATSGQTFCYGFESTLLVWFYFGDAPKPPNGSNNYRYTVKIQPLGWFGTRTSPKDRFDGYITGYTQ